MSYERCRGDCRSPQGTKAPTPIHLRRNLRSKKKRTRSDKKCLSISAARLRRGPRAMAPCSSAETPLRSRRHSSVAERHPEPNICTSYLWDCCGHQPAQVQISSANPRARPRDPLEQIQDSCLPKEEWGNARILRAQVTMAGRDWQWPALPHMSLSIRLALESMQDGVVGARHSDSAQMRTKQLREIANQDDH
jgi:hypothetical protein